MANNYSAKKMVRKILARTEVSSTRRSRVRTFVRKVEEAIEAGNQDEARTALGIAEPEIMRCVTKGIIKKSTASRKVSRLAKRVNAMQAAA
jgi:small subunit ribosomal protein S20